MMKCNNINDILYLYVIQDHNLIVSDDLWVSFSFAD